MYGRLMTMLWLPVCCTTYQALQAWYVQAAVLEAHAHLWQERVFLSVECTHEFMRVHSDNDCSTTSGWPKLQQYIRYPAIHTMSKCTVVPERTCACQRPIYTNACLILGRIHEILYDSITNKSVKVLS